MRAICTFLAVSFVSASLASGSQFRVFYYLPKSDSSRLSMVLEAPDSGTAAKIFRALLPAARLSEVKQISAH